MKFKLKEIENIQKKKYSGTVHDLTVKDNHSYNIKNVIVHNSICKTRQNTGFGVPLLTSVAECAVVRESATIVADGGIRFHGDIPKAIAFGADFCMLGKMFAATDLAAGDCYDENMKLVCDYASMQDLDDNQIIKYKQYRGMASKEARKGVLSDASIEGVTGFVKYAGKTSDFIKDLKNNLKAALSYGGVTDWSRFRKDVKARIISSASWRESEINVKEM